MNLLRLSNEEILRCRQEFEFPPVGKADEDGLLAWGGDLLADRLVSAYSRGIFRASGR